MRIACVGSALGPTLVSPLLCAQISAHLARWRETIPRTDAPIKLIGHLRLATARTPFGLDHNAMPCAMPCATPPFLGNVTRPAPGVKPIAAASILGKRRDRLRSMTLLARFQTLLVQLLGCFPASRERHIIISSFAWVSPKPMSEVLGPAKARFAVGTMAVT